MGTTAILNVCQVLGLDPDKVEWEAPGVNHCIWLTHFLYEGQDIYPMLDKWIQEEGPTTGRPTCRRGRTTFR